MCKLKYYLLQNAMLKLYYTLVHTHLNYGIFIWGNMYLFCLSKLNKLQNKAIRIAMVTGWNNSAYPLYCDQNILPLPLIIKFETAKLLHKHKNSQLSINFENYFTLVISRHSCRTRTSVNNQLNIPLFRTQKMQRLIKFIGTKIWNLKDECLAFQCRL